jgi:hypothetical protein
MVRKLRQSRFNYCMKNIFKEMFQELNLTLLHNDVPAACFADLAFFCNVYAVTRLYEGLCLAIFH